MNTQLKTHVALNTTRFDTTLAFYRVFLGADPVKLRDGYAKFDLDQPPLNLTLNATGTDSTLTDDTGVGQINHLGIQVGSTDAVTAATERLRASGLVTLEEKDTDCCYALQDKVWVADPDGIRWEVFVVKVADTGAAAPEATAKTETCCPSTCCAAA